MSIATHILSFIFALVVLGSAFLVSFFVSVAGLFCGDYVALSLSLSGREWALVST
jgi:hypothetical protein